MNCQASFSILVCLAAGVPVMSQPLGAQPEPAKPPQPVANPPPTHPGTTPTSFKASIDPDLEKRLEEVDARAAKVESLRAKFEQRKHTPLLKKPLISTGTLTAKAERARWDTLSPHASTTTLDARELRVYYPEQRTVEIYQLGQDVREFAGATLPRLEKLKASFSIAAIKPSALGESDDNKELLAIELTPLAAQLRERVARVRVLIDTALPAARRLEILDPDGDRTEMVFTDIRLGEKIEPAELTLDTPSGVREVRPLAKLAPKPSKPTGSGK